MFYVIRKTKSGGLVVSDKAPSTGKGLLKGAFRFPGQRYQVPSPVAIAAMTEDTEVVDAAQELVDSLNPGDPITFANPTNDSVTVTRDADNNILETPIVLTRKWADVDLEKLESALEKFMVEPAATGAARGAKAGKGK